MHLDEAERMAHVIHFRTQEAWPNIQLSFTRDSSVSAVPQQLSWHVTKVGAELEDKRQRLQELARSEP